MNHYNCGANEAINRFYGFSDTSTADSFEELAAAIAEGLYKSPGHWAYWGDAKMLYIAAGSEYQGQDLFRHVIFFT